MQHINERFLETIHTKVKPALYKAICLLEYDCKKNAKPKEVNELIVSQLDKLKEELIGLINVQIITINAE